LLCYLGQLIQLRPPIGNGKIDKIILSQFTSQNYFVSIYPKLARIRRTHV